MTSLKLRVHGLPAPQGSKRHVGGGRMIEASKKVGPWREAIVAEVKRLGYEDLLIDEPTFLRVTFLMPRPASHRTATGEVRSSAPVWPHKTPDLDKLLRSTLDGLTQAGVLADDARVVVIAASKTYADKQAPGALIHIETEENT